MDSLKNNLALFLAAIMLYSPLNIAYSQDKQKVAASFETNFLMGREKSAKLIRDFLMSKSDTKEMNRKIEDSYLNQYIDNCTIVKNDSDKRTLYVILQEHAQNSDKIDKNINKKLVEDALPCQVSIYRILEGLKDGKFPGQKSRLELIALEGMSHKEIDDMTRGEEIADQISRGTPKIEDNANLEAYLKKGYANAGALIGARYKDLFVMGFEKGIKASNEAIKGFEIYQNRRQGNLLNLKGATQEERRAIAEYMSYKIFTLSERSEDSIKYAIQHADTLYSKGMIKNKDAAIVIGAGHELDFLKKAEENTTYNLMIISPKGVSRIK